MHVTKIIQLQNRTLVAANTVKYLPCMLLHELNEWN